MLVSKRPTYTPDEAEALALEHYKLSANAKELPSERDQNFRLSTAEGEPYLLKIAHPDEAEEVLDFQMQALDQLTASYFPKLLPDKRGKRLIEITDSQGQRHFLRMLTYLPGSPIAEYKVHSPSLLEAVGKALGEMDKTLSGLNHPAMHRFLQWNSKQGVETVRSHLSYIPDTKKRALVEQFITTFEEHTTPLLPTLRQSVIHNDVNDYNLLVKGDGVTGIIDFGDMVRSFTVCDLANACAYLMMDKPKPLEVIRYLTKGYNSAYSLEPSELSVLLDFIYLRLCLSVSIGAKQQAQNPDNAYLAISKRPAWDLLETLAKTPVAQLRQQLSTTLSN